MRWNWAGLSVLHCDWSAGLIDGCCAAGLLQDSTGMKMWKKRWFVLSDMCLFYYRGESSICVMCLVFLYMHENIHLRALSDFCCGKWHVCAAVCGFCVAYFSNHGTVNMEMMLKEWLNYVCPSQKFFNDLNQLCEFSNREKIQSWIILITSDSVWFFWFLLNKEPHWVIQWVNR